MHETRRSGAYAWRFSGLSPHFSCLFDTLHGINGRAANTDSVALGGAIGQQQQFLLESGKGSVGERGVATLPVVADRDPREERRPCCGARGPLVPLHEFGFAGGAEAFRHGVVEARPGAAHRADQADAREPRRCTGCRDRCGGRAPATGGEAGAHLVISWWVLPPFDDHLPLVLCGGAGESTPPGAGCRKVVSNG